MLTRQDFIDAVTSVDHLHADDIPLDDYIDVCQELIDHFTESRDNAIDDLEHEDA